MRAAADENVMQLSWAFGFSRDVTVHNLCDDNRSAIFYVSAHTGVIYDLTSKTQQLLQGHCNPISCTCVSADRRWIATADRGPDSMVVLWDSYTATPVKTISMPHPGGVRVMDLCPNARFLVTLSDDDAPQLISIWDLAAAETDSVLYTAQVGSSRGEDAAEAQICVRFDPTDVCSIISNGPSIAIFWSCHEGQLSYYAPPLGERDFKQPVGALTQSCFIPGTRRAVSATSDGDAVLWDCVELPEVASTDRRATKLIKLHSGALLSLLTVGELLVSGGADGHVRFFDFDFRVVAWFEALDAGPVASISFAHQPAALKTPGADGASFSCPDFVVGTSNALVIACTAAMFEQLHADARRGTLLVQGQDAPVHGLAAHPSLTRFACTGHSGLLQLWDYADKRLLLMRMFDRLLGHCLAFSPNGKLLAVGFTNGTLKLLAGMTLEELGTFRASREAVTHIAFSSDSTVLATADADRCVGIFRHGATAEEAAKREWEYLGKYRSHHAPISGLQFGDGADGLPRLFSTGEDSQLVEYDLQRSSISGGIQLRRATRVEQSASPTACLWLGATPGRAEPSVVVANDQYKLRLVAADSKTVEETLLGPTYGGPIGKMLLLPSPPADAAAAAAAAAAATAGADGADGGEGEAAAAPTEEPQYLCYATHDKVVGLLKLPLDGNPNKGMGLVAHPGEVSAVAASWDGAYLLTAGGADLAIHMWKVTPAALAPTIAAGGAGLAPYLGLLEGGAGGPLHQEMRDFFYYAQLRAQGEETTEPRRISGRVPISELGSLMRALGYYPSEREIDELMHEARAAQQVAGGEHLDTVDFDAFVKLYVNHRPVFGVGKEAIAAAFKAIGADGIGQLPREALARALGSQGETLTTDDLAQCLRALTGVDDLEQLLGLKGQIDASNFAEKVLGFQDYE